MSDIKVGDTVTIKEEEYFTSKLGKHGMLCVDADTIRGMAVYASQEAKIAGKKDGYYMLDIDDGNYYWSEFELESMSQNN